MKFMSLKYLISLAKRIWKWRFNKILLGALVIIVIIDWAAPSSANGIASIVIAMLIGHLFYIEILKEKTKE